MPPRSRLQLPALRREMRGVRFTAIFTCRSPGRIRSSRRRPFRRARGQPARAERRLLGTCSPIATSPSASFRPLHRYNVKPSPTTVNRCWRRLRATRPRQPEPTIVVLTPGVGNSAYFEHAFLAREMGIRARRRARPPGPRQHRLHEDDVRAATRGRDLPSRRRRLPGPSGVSAGIRDPWVWPGFSNAYRAGNVSLANAIGTGVADDKASTRICRRSSSSTSRRSRSCRTFRLTFRQPSGSWYVLENLGSSS